VCVCVCVSLSLSLRLVKSDHSYNKQPTCLVLATQ